MLKALHNYKPLAFLKNGEKVLIQQEFDNLFWYDIEKETSSEVEIVDTSEMFRTSTSIGILVLLDGDSVLDVELEEGELDYEVKNVLIFVKFLVVFVFLCFDL